MMHVPVSRPSLLTLFVSSRFPSYRKSAILCAIQICLGAGARRTNRARNLKDLVRKDAGSTPSCAKIEVTVLNGGADAYKHDIYGDTITVQRTISLAGGFNGYKLLDENQKEQSRSKKDLDEMLDTLNIQVENPVAVLDQEEAKKFLMGKAEDKYKFFEKATELERLSRTFASTSDTVAELTDSHNQIQDTLDRDNERVQELKQKWEQHQELEKLKDKVRQMQVKYAWAVYNAHEAEWEDAVKVRAE